MKNIFGLFLLLLMSLGHGSFAQTYKCGWYGKKTIEERNKIFPFNKAKKVMLIAYSNHELGSEEEDSFSVDNARTVNPKIINKYSIQGRYRTKVYFSTEEKILSKESIDELSNILVNYTLKRIPRGDYAVTITNCYTPRNSILFFDESNTIIACLEICFECGQMYLNPDTNNINAYSQMDECTEKLNIIKNLFRKNEITYGTDR